MTILARLAERSWEPASDRDPREPEGRPSAGSVGLTVYFAVAMVMFSLLGAAYYMRMGLHAAMGHADDWVSMPDPPLLWINSAILMASSLAWEMARRSSAEGRAARASLAGAALGLCFLVGQWLLWRHYQMAGYYLSSNPANAFFYLLTALHGLHIVGGLVAAGWVLTESNPAHLRLCAIYWHFLLFLWILIAALLLST
ncbi:cytochrome c oxidase subunit 3 [Sphingobium sp. EP60837]|uniref:cytochrome c oxidase subunit 3 n=1 Tax=Sphingobium sp. EP60837 TaxID=1855519 RepID=UPI0007DE313F|nr:cytochrome oxidase subunit III [Sphingobium sp. EP60837]ANI77562.1 Cytochrome-c oxidase [Sphingobium sp. EP60837]